MVVLKSNRILVTHGSLRQTVSNEFDLGNGIQLLYASDVDGCKNDYIVNILYDR